MNEMNEVVKKKASYPLLLAIFSFNERDER